MGDRPRMSTSPRLRWSRILAVLIAALCIPLVMAACGGDDSDSGEATTEETGEAAANGEASGEPIVIGAAVGETGFLSIFDLPALNALRIAVNDLNAQGGVDGRQVEIVTADMKSDTALGASTALEVIDKGADIGMVPCDLDFGAPGAIEFAKHDIVSFSGCAGAPDYGPRGISPMTFSAGMSTTNEAAGGAVFANDEGWKRGFSFHGTELEYNSTWTEFFQKSFEKLGGEWVGQETFEGEDPSVQTQVTRLRNMDPQPDFLTVCSPPPGGPVVVRQIRAAGIDLPIIMCVAMEGLSWLPSVPGLQDAFVTTYGDWNGDDPRDRVNDLFAEYISEYGEEPNSSHPLQGFGLADIIKTAVEDAGTTDGPELKAALEQFDQVETTAGCTTFDEEWHVSFCREVVIKEIKDGNLTYVTSVDPAAEDVVFYPGE